MAVQGIKCRNFSANLRLSKFCIGCVHFFYRLIDFFFLLLVHVITIHGTVLLINRIGLCFCRLQKLCGPVRINPVTMLCLIQKLLCFIHLGFNIINRIIGIYINCLFYLFPITLKTQVNRSPSGFQHPDHIIRSVDRLQLIQHQNRLIPYLHREHPILDARCRIQPFPILVRQNNALHRHVDRALRLLWRDDIFPILVYLWNPHVHFPRFRYIYNVYLLMNLIFCRHLDF